MTVSTSVKWAVSSMLGSPVLNGTAGSMIAVLDAFLVNGFGTKAVDNAQVTSGVCRLAITGTSAALDHSVIVLAGVTGGGAVLNGEQRVKTATASYVEFACSQPDGPLTGTITFKIAPLGWEKVFSKTNVAVYRSTDPAGTRAYYRVDDTNALFARVAMYESMADVDTGVGLGPQSSQLAGGFYWHKRASAGATGVYWTLIGDSRLFYPLVAPAAGASAISTNGFGLRGNWAGDINSQRSGDAWSAGLGGAVTASYSDIGGCIFSSAVTTGSVLQRQSHGLGGVVATARFVTGNNAAVSGADASLGGFPSRAGNALITSPITLSDGDMAASGPRGDLPGAYHCPQTGVLASFGTDAKLTDGVGTFAGRKLLSVGVGVLTGQATGCALVDVTGPWRTL